MSSRTTVPRRSSTPGSLLHSSVRRKCPRSNSCMRGLLIDCPDRPEKKYTDTDGVAAFVALTYVHCWTLAIKIEATCCADVRSGDEAIKFTSCLTDWALPDLTPKDHIDTNFAGDLNPPAVSEIETQSKQAAPKWVAPFNLAFNTRLGYFDWLELLENVGRLNRFGHAMTGTRQWETKDSILKGRCYPV